MKHIKVLSCKHCPLEESGFCGHPDAPPNMQVTAEWDNNVVHDKCPFYSEPELHLSLATNAVTMEVKKHLGCCPQCGSGDMKWCDISVRAYCRECSYWAPVNSGSREDGLLTLKNRQLRAKVETTNMV